MFFDFSLVVLLDYLVKLLQIFVFLPQAIKL